MRARHGPFLSCDLSCLLTSPLETATEIRSGWCKIDRNLGARKGGCQGTRGAADLFSGVNRGWAVGNGQHRQDRTTVLNLSESDHPRCVCSVTQSCLTLCDPMDCGPPGSSVHGILQARILVWVAVPSSRGSSLPRIEPVALMSPALAGGVFTTNATWGRLPLVSGKLHTSRPSP